MHIEKFLDTWIMNDEKMFNSAVIVNRHGVMTVDNLLGVPLCNGANQRWIDNYGSLIATGCRFGSEGGGFTAVYNYGKVAGKHPWSGGGRIHIRNSLIACGQMARENGGVIRLFALPAQLVLENNYEMTVVPFIVLDPSLDVEAEIKKNPRGTSTARYHIFNNRMANPAVNAVPVELKRFFSKESDCRFSEIKARPVPAEITGLKKLNLSVPSEVK